MAESTLKTFTVTLHEGETIVLPSDVVITGVFVDGTASLTSSCTGTLPASTDYKCGVFYMNIDDDSSPNHPNDETSTYYTQLIIDDTLAYGLDGPLNGVTDPDFLNAYVPPQGLFTFTHINIFGVDDSGTDKRKAVYLYFKVAEPFFDQVQLKITSHIGDVLQSPQFYKPMTDEDLEGADDLDCGDFPF